MTIRVSAQAIDVLRRLVETHLRKPDAGINVIELAAFLCAALEYARSSFPLIGRKGAVVDAEEIPADRVTRELWSAIDLEPRPDDCVRALFDLVPLQVVDGGARARASAPRAYPASLRDWPDELGRCVGEKECVLWSENVFGIIAEPGWLRDPIERNAAFGAIDPIYDQLSFVEIDRGSAHRLACFLFAGAERRSAFKTFNAQAKSFVSLYGATARFFSNRDLGDEQLRDPFLHGERVDLGSRDQCAGGSLLVVLVTNGEYVVRLEELWDRWVES